jgi:glycosyltransferase involved in cell wall biosynthesis
VTPSVSAIVPVFNEEMTVARIVVALHASPLIGEIICVDDGSTDGSRAILDARVSCPRSPAVSLSRPSPCAEPWWA